VRWVGDVTWHEHGLAAGLLDPPLGVLGILVLLLKVGDQDIRPLPGKGDGYRLADA